MHLDLNLVGFLQQGNGLIFAGGLVVIVALVAMAHLVSAVFLHFFRKKLPTARKLRLAPGKKLVAFLLATALLFVGTTFIFGGMTAKTYTAFTRAEQLGIVECLAWHPAEQFMVVSLTQLENGKPVRSQTYSLYGDRWELSAHILKWHAGVNLLGLHTGYRLNQIKGTYALAEDENRKPHRAYALSTGTDLIWALVSKYSGRIPFVEAVYGNAVSQPARPGERFDVFVTTSGLTTRRHP